MSEVRFSILMSTSGRNTLGNAVNSLATQLAPGDEVLILCDRSGDWGDTGRNALMPRAQGTHILFLDDDDEFLPGGLAKVRRFAEENPGRIGIFRASRQGIYEDRWRVKKLIDTSTGMYCVPNIPDKLSRYAASRDDPRGRMGDIRFIEETIALHGADPVWLDELVYVVRPEKNRWRLFRMRLALRYRLKKVLGRNPPRYPDTLPDWLMTDR